MYEIAKGYPYNKTSIKSISEKQDVSAPFLEQILSRLRKAGIINSVKGPGGGYMLSRTPEEITIASIVNELEGPLAITSCLNPEEGCVRVDSCVIHLLWKSLGNQIEAFLNTITLGDLINGNPIDEYFPMGNTGANHEVADA